MKKVAIISITLCMFGCYNPNNRMALKTGFEGKPMPSFNILLNDSTTDLNTNAIPNGEPIVLLFFSPQCPYCRAEISDIVKNISTLNGIRFYVFTNWPFRNFKSFYTHFQLNRYTNIVAGQDYMNYFAGHFNATGVPYTMIYDREKKLDKAFMGRLTVEQIKETIKVE